MDAAVRVIHDPIDFASDAARPAYREFDDAVGGTTRTRGGEYGFLPTENKTEIISRARQNISPHTTNLA